jgi:hypothetical protein
VAIVKIVYPPSDNLVEVIDNYLFQGNIGTLPIFVDNSECFI